MGPAKWTYSYLYVISLQAVIDIFSRRGVGWCGPTKYTLPVRKSSTRLTAPTPAASPTSRLNRQQNPPRSGSIRRTKSSRSKLNLDDRLSHSR